MASQHFNMSEIVRPERTNITPQLNDIFGLENQSMLECTTHQSFTCLHVC